MRYMRFIHTADLHLGKTVCGQSLINYQKEVLNQILMYASSQDIDAIVIAGDVYDRAIPSVEAVDLFNEFLILSNSYHIPVLCIGGNHDSETRLNFASTLLTNNNIHIVSRLQEKMPCITIKDVNFYFLPFAKPHTYREFDPDLPTLQYQDAVQRYMDKQTIDKSKTNVLITHYFVTGSFIQSESELPLSVGGSEQIDYHLFDDFDYVALGHLHAPQKIKRETMRYAGSPLRYSFDETKQNKSFSVVTIEDKHVEVECVDFHVSRTLIVLRDTFDNLMNSEGSQQFVAFELMDQALIPNAMESLKAKFPYALTLSYVHLHDENVKVNSLDHLKKLDDVSLFQEFYQSIRNTPLDEKGISIVEELLNGGVEQ